MAAIEVTEFAQPKGRYGAMLPLGRLPALANTRQAFDGAAVAFNANTATISVIADADARFKVSAAGSAAGAGDILLKANVRVDFEVDAGQKFTSTAAV